MGVQDDTQAGECLSDVCWCWALVLAPGVILLVSFVSAEIRGHTRSCFIVTKFSEVYEIL